VIYLPVCVFVVNVPDNKALYAWVADPQVEVKSATLRFHESGIFHPLDSAAVSGIIDRVKAWYPVPPSQLMPVRGSPRRDPSGSTGCRANIPACSLRAIRPKRAAGTLRLGRSGRLQGR
jgi:hypothetical protein